MVPPPDETPRSLGDGVTGSDVERAEDSPPQSLGDQVTGADFDDGLDDFDKDVLDCDEIVDLEARYEIIEVLGRGEMGEVLKAKERRPGQTFNGRTLREKLGRSPDKSDAVAYLFQAVRTPLSTMAAWVEAGAF